MVREQFIDVADKELVPLLREKWFKTLKEAATWADDRVLAHRSEPRTGSGFKESGPRGPGGSGSASSRPSRSPPHSYGFANKSEFGKSQSLSLKGGIRRENDFQHPKVR